MNIAANPIIEADQTVYLKDYQTEKLMATFQNVVDKDLPPMAHQM